jgi:hypothetical protein
MISKKEGSKKLIDKCFSVNVLKDGMINATISNERQLREMKQTLTRQ